MPAAPAGATIGGMSAPLPLGEKDRPRGLPLLRLGFRPFFAAAALYAVIAMGLWWWLLAAAPQDRIGIQAPVMWHAHEMLFGYALAVIAGFLLTAVRNWTGLPTPRGALLAALALLWLAGRLLVWGADPALARAAEWINVAFPLALAAAIAVPIWRRRQWVNLAICGKVALLALAAWLFHEGLAGRLQYGSYMGRYLALYTIVSLIFMMGRRVVPFFIERGVEGEVTLRNRRWVDLSSLVLYLAFTAVETLSPLAPAALVPAGTVLAALLALIHGLRLYDWHTPGIWRKPLLWVLYLAYAWLVAGLALRALAPLAGWPLTVAVHAFAAGGIGMMTLGMMARVSLGHTGRNVFEPPRSVGWMFGLVLAAALVRVAAAWAGEATLALIQASQFLWMAAFGLFAMVYLPMLWQPRVDGADG